MDAERFSGLVADIYDAALDPPMWRKALKGACEFVRGGPSASLFWQDAAKKTGHSYFVWGGDPHYAKLYWDKYIALNPLSGAIFFPVGEVYSGTDILPHKQFVETPFYKEWMAPQGWGDVLSVNLDKSATGHAVFSVARHVRDGLIDDEMRRRMRLLIPHVRRSMIIGRLIDLNRVEAAALTDTLDGLEAGMFLVDSCGRLVHANASGRAMLDEGNVLHANGKLVARDRQTDEALRDVFSAAGNGDAALGSKQITVQLTARDGERFVTHVLPLTSGARRRAGVSYSAVAAVFVQKSGQTVSLAIDALAQQFSFTPAELRVVNAMVDVGGVSEVACALKLSQATIRTHLRHIFEKTGVRRQADLVKLIASHPAPIVVQSLNGGGPHSPSSRHAARAGARVLERQFVPTPASRRIFP